MCPRGRKKPQNPDCSDDSDSTDGSPSPTDRAIREADLESPRERERNAEQEIQHLNTEAARIRAARRKYIEIWKARKMAAEAGNSNDQPPPPGNSTA